MRIRRAAAVACAAALAGPAAAVAAEPQIRVLSNRADLVSGGSALVAVDPAGADPATVRVDVDGRDVTSAFAVRPDGRYVGMLEGLRTGENLVSARLPGDRGARLTIVNHPIGGPVIDGPQIQPWACFAGALDAQCNRRPEVEWLYMPEAGGGLAPYDPASPPSGVAQTTTDNGATVPYIVRLETGAIDRDQYRMAVLWDPAEPWAPWAPQPGYNRKLVIFHGASCDTAYGQAQAPDVLNETALSRGFATMSHALDNAGHNCNILTQAESLIMTKEHLQETFGEVRYTIGSGCSGGSLVQQQVANAFPGVYQGITPACSFPDAWSSAMLYVDYQLLRRYFENPLAWEPGVIWGIDDIQAAEGHPNPVNAVTFTSVIPSSGDPSRSCPSVPADKVYDPQTNPRGVRCSLQDYMVNVFGRRPKDGFAGRPFDNVGVEYGKQGLMAGLLTAGQFADLNAKAGAWDIDYNPTAERTAADRFALERAYRSGAVNQATFLDRVAIIDLRGPDPGAFHDVYRTYALRARLDREHGGHDNQVLWRGPVPLLGDAGYADEAILAMDEWLARVEADRRDIPLARKIVLDRPESLTDRCGDGVPGGVELPLEVCDAIVTSYSTARIQAGMPFTDDTMKCELRPLRRSNYFPVSFSNAEWEKLRKAFPDGVCDYSKPGVDRTPTVPWLTYEDGPGGEPLGPAPVSAPLAAGDDSLGLPAPGRCVSRRSFRIRLEAPAGERLTRARVQVNGKVVKRLGRKTVAAPVVLRRLPGGAVRVRVVAYTAKGRRIERSRRYRTCPAKRRSGR